MEETDAHEEELFSMDDIKLEVMRARGAGGQVTTKHVISQYHTYSLSPKSTSTKRNQPSGSPIYPPE